LAKQVKVVASPKFHEYSDLPKRNPTPPATANHPNAKPIPIRSNKRSVDVDREKEKNINQDIILTDESNHQITAPTGLLSNTHSSK
jgi:hypothetical protein